MKASLFAAVGAALIIPLAETNPTAVFEDGGVRIGNEVVTGKVVHIKGDLLVSGTLVEPLVGPVTVRLAGDRSIVLEPGVRLERTAGGFRLRTHGRRFIRIGSIEERAPIEVHLTGEGFEFRPGGTVAGREVTAALAPETGSHGASAGHRPSGQDPFGREPAQEQPGAGKTRFRRVWDNNPLAMGEVVNKHAIRFLTEVSPLGESNWIIRKK